MEELAALDSGNRMKFVMHLTSAKTSDLQALAQETARQQQKTDLISGIHSQNTIRTSLGRPNWDDVFSELCREFPHQTVGVFFCGPPALQAVLQEHCTKYSRLRRRAGYVQPEDDTPLLTQVVTAANSTTEFDFFAENF